VNTDCDFSLPQSEHSMSNCDGAIDAGMENDLRNGMRSSHAGWNFWGDVWFDDGQFHEAVRQYHSHVTTISADSLRELMDDVNSEYGDK